MSVEFLVMASVVVIAVAFLSLVIGKAFDQMGSDDREPEESKPADLWKGYERRKTKPYE